MSNIWIIPMRGGGSYGFAHVLHIGLYDYVLYVFIDWSYRLYIINYFSSIENIFFAGSFAGSFEPPSGVSSGTFFPGISRGSHICSIWFIMAEPFSYTFISWNEPDIESNGHIGNILCIICRKGWEHGLLSGSFAGSFGPPSGTSFGVSSPHFEDFFRDLLGEEVPRDFARFSHISFMILLSEVVLSPFSMRHIPIILSIICRRVENIVFRGVFRGVFWTPFGGIFGDFFPRGSHGSHKYYWPFFLLKPFSYVFLDGSYTYYIVYYKS